MEQTMSNNEMSIEQGMSPVNRTFRLPSNGTTIQLQFSNWSQFTDYMTFYTLLEDFGIDIIFELDMGLRELNDREEEELYEDRCYAFLVIAMSMTMYFGIHDCTHCFWLQHWTRTWDVCVDVVGNVPEYAQRLNHLAVMSGFAAIRNFQTIN